MVRKIGNLFLFLTILIPVYAQNPMLSLSLEDTRNNVIKSPAAGTPFCVVVHVKHDRDIVSYPKVYGLDEFVQGQTRTSSSMRIINGKKENSVTFYYTIRIDKEGTFVVGPASLSYKGKVITSDPLTITVGSKQTYQDGSQDAVSAELELVPHKEEVYAGEPVLLDVFFTADSGIEVAQELEITFPGWVIGSYTKPKKKEANNKISIGQTVEIFHYQPGEQKLPALSVMCAVPVRRTRSAFGSWFDDDFFGPAYEKKQITSNKVAIRILPLPDYKNIVHAVGQFKSITASIDHDTAKVGEGIILKLIIEGRGNGMGLEAPELMLPDGFRYYDSKHDLVQTAYGWSKTFEYVLQASNEGTFTIPEQKFTYFDYVDKKFLTLRTDFLSLTIVEGGQKGLAIVQSGNDEQKGKEQIRSLSLAKDTMPPVRFPWWLFFLISGLGIVIAGGLYVYRIIMDYFERNADKIRFKKAFYKARNALMKCHQENDSKQLYAVIIGLFSARCRVAPSTVSQKFIDTKLRENGLSHSMLDKWKLYFDTLAAHAFSLRKSEESLFLDMEEWISIFEKIL